MARSGVDQYPKVFSASGRLCTVPRTLFPPLGPNISEWGPGEGECPGQGWLCPRLPPWEPTGAVGAGGTPSYLRPKTTSAHTTFSWQETGLEESVAPEAVKWEDPLKCGCVSPEQRANITAIQTICNLEILQELSRSCREHPTFVN